MVKKMLDFCRRQQGFIVAKGNPGSISTVSDLGQPKIKIANRSEGKGTRLLLDRELEKAGLDGIKIEGYRQEFRDIAQKLDGYDLSLCNKMVFPKESKGVSDEKN